VVGEVVDVAEAALEVADFVGDMVDTDRRRKRWKGCLFLLALIALLGLLYALLAD